MLPVTPANFWRLYNAELRDGGSWEAYQSNPVWTKIAIRAATAVCDQLGLRTTTEYLRLDLLGYDENQGDVYDWNARVAFEVENGAYWRDELCKLSHIVANLCVLAAYESHATRTAKEALEENLQILGDRIHRVLGRQWLFIFGPSWKAESDPWNAYTLDSNRGLVSVDEGPPLRGVDLRGQP